ncbi:hypothetical protein JDV02_007234 [Purpureocillium takamizusanense]|uniref:2EXR domain-containing protein n=1 Tax=Purpureocillium takamizusanense TaxID=2060973 RepID=A0A9Q8QM36_9HYPO|nr:uncharacterized protein JDV02_007234 [Purpureocillium takamizusanense]UNI21224.1 hypothetical protein JDV02_007234 [Purpureocillium takamizusanense]
MAFRLADLPPEIRHLIWGATLPGRRRVFHVRDCVAKVVYYPNPGEEEEGEAEEEEGGGNHGVQGHEEEDDGGNGGVDSPRTPPSWHAPACREEEERTFDFHIRHPPPSATQICRESRAVALSWGFFLFAANNGNSSSSRVMVSNGVGSSSTSSSRVTSNRVSSSSRVTSSRSSRFRSRFSSRFSGGSPGLWFNPQRDMLYLDRNMRHRIKAEPRLQQQHAVAVANGMDKVLHVGVEWRAWFRDIPRLLHEGDNNGDDDEQGEEGQGDNTDTDNTDMRMVAHWRSAMEALLLCCPSAGTISFVLPRVRHVGGVTFGREPYGAARYPCDLAPLPDEVRVPWEKKKQQQPLGAAAAAGTAGAGLALAALLAGGGSSSSGGGSTRSALTEWRAIRREMQSALASLAYDKKGAEMMSRRHGWEEEEEEDTKKGKDRALVAAPAAAATQGGRRNGTRATPTSATTTTTTATTRTTPTPPKVQGWWLLRAGAPTDYEQQQVREFLS